MWMWYLAFSMAFNNSGNFSSPFIRSFTSLFAVSGQLPAFRKYSTKVLLFLLINPELLIVSE